MSIKYRVELPNIMKQKGLPLTAVEIGTADGGSACDFMANGLDKIICVDPWNNIPGQKGDGGYDNAWHHKNLKVATERLSKYGDNVQLLRGLSSEMAWMIPDNSVGMLYLDGNHSYEGVMSDLINYYNKVVKGGIVAGHDFLQESYGVKKAVVDFCKIYGYQWYIIPENKDEDAGFYFFKK